MDSSSEATPLLVTAAEDVEISQDQDEDEQAPTCTRVRRNQKKRSSLPFSFGSSTKDKKQQQRQQHQHASRASFSPIFDFGSTIIRELSHDFADYEKSGSIALNALHSIEQPIINEGELLHPTLLDPVRIKRASVLIVEEELDYGDLKWSLISNTFFICGGFCASIDVILDTVDTMNGQIDNPNRKISKLRVALGLLGPILYSLNSIVDITWARRVEQRQDRRQQLEDLQIDLIAPDKNVEVVEEQRTKSVRLKLPFEPHNLLRRLKIHISHRRALSAAVAFLVGSMLYFASSYLGEFSTTISEEGLHVIDAFSVNAYVVSALLALTKKGDEIKLKPWTEVWNDSPRLESLGDILFGIAVTVDLSICYMHLDEWDSAGFIWPLISALLWQFDAFCYLRADVNSMTLYNASRPLGDTVASSETSSTGSVSSEIVTTDCLPSEIEMDSN